MMSSMSSTPRRRRSSWIVASSSTFVVAEAALLLLCCCCRSSSALLPVASAFHCLRPPAPPPPPQASSPLRSRLLRRRPLATTPLHFAPPSPPLPSEAAAAGGCHSVAAARSPLFAASASASAVAARTADGGAGLREGGKRAALVKAGMMAYIASMCLALPLTLLPVKLLYKLNLIGRIRKENLSLVLGQLCSRFLLRLIPFASIRLTPHIESDPVPSVWVCNHISMLDIFFLLGTDYKLRGRNKRPIKIVYWKGLESNPITKLLFTMSGFISVDMEDNGNGNANQYNKSTFKQLLKDVKQAFDEGFDIGILPEGQPNPTPEEGLQPIYTGAFTLARMSRRPVRMMALYGLHKLWHPSDAVGMEVSGRDVRMRVYPPGRDGGKFESADEFAATFEAVVGHFGATGEDLPKEELEGWLDGSAWEERKREKEQEEEEEQRRAVEMAKEAAESAEAAAMKAASEVEVETSNESAALESEAGADVAESSPALASDATDAVEEDDGDDVFDADDYALVAERAGKRRAAEAKRLFDLAFSRPPMSAPIFASRDLLSALSGDELAEAEEAGRRRAEECKRRFEEVMGRRRKEVAEGANGESSMSADVAANGANGTTANGSGVGCGGRTELTAALDELSVPEGQTSAV